MSFPGLESAGAFTAAGMQKKQSAAILETPQLPAFAFAEHTIVICMTPLYNIWI